jgi:thiamine-phosphate pyrophosphorylase
MNSRLYEVGESFQMNKSELLSSVRLYVIADKGICGDRDIEEVVSLAIEGGAGLIQYRDKKSDDKAFYKTALRLSNICKDMNVPFIVNDRVEIALKTDAGGVHLGEEDVSIKEARSVLGPNKIIGKTVRTIPQAIKAEEEGADYVGLGPIFHTTSKQITEPIGTEIIGKAQEVLKIPVFPIGGINLSNLDQVIRDGGKRIAVVSAVVISADVKSAATVLVERIKSRNLT